MGGLMGADIGPPVRSVHLGPLSSGGWAYFRITSSKLSLDDLTRRMGRGPDRGWSVGDPWRPEAGAEFAVRRFTSWYLESGLPRTSLLDDHLDALFSTLGGFASTTPDVFEGLQPVLMIAQRLEPGADMGIHLSTERIAVLDTLRAALDIGQYVVEYDSRASE